MSKRRLLQDMGSVDYGYGMASYGYGEPGYGETSYGEPGYGASISGTYGMVRLDLPTAKCMLPFHSHVINTMLLHTRVLTLFLIEQWSILFC